MDERLSGLSVHAVHPEAEQGTHHAEQQAHETEKMIVDNSSAEREPFIIELGRDRGGMGETCEAYQQFAYASKEWIDQGLHQLQDFPLQEIFA